MHSCAKAKQGEVWLSYAKAGRRQCIDPRGSATATSTTAKQGKGTATHSTEERSNGKATQGSASERRGIAWLGEVVRMVKRCITPQGQSGAKRVKAQLRLGIASQSFEKQRLRRERRGDDPPRQSKARTCHATALHDTAQLRAAWQWRRANGQLASRGDFSLFPIDRVRGLVVSYRRTRGAKARAGPPRASRSRSRKGD